MFQEWLQHHLMLQHTIAGSAHRKCHCQCHNELELEAYHSTFVRLLSICVDEIHFAIVKSSVYMRTSKKDQNCTRWILSLPRSGKRSIAHRSWDIKQCMWEIAKWSQSGLNHNGLDKSGLRDNWLSNNWLADKWLSDNWLADKWLGDNWLNISANHLGLHLSMWVMPSSKGRFRGGAEDDHDNHYRGAGYDDRLSRPC